MIRVIRIFSRRSFISKPSIMNNSTLSGYKAINEPVLVYKSGSAERKALEETLGKYTSVTTIPIVIGDEEHYTDDVHYQVSPFDHQRKIAKYHYATPDLIQKAIDTSVATRKSWEQRPLEERCRVFLRAADLLSTKYHSDIVATTMLGQGKTIIQAEIDAAAELIDFYRFGVQFAMEHTNYQPISTDTVTNSFRLRGIEGFWVAISPFNFTAIGGHLPAGPALAGNVTVWKPSDTAMLSNYTVFKVLQEAGLPPGVINFVPADGPTFGNVVTSSPDLAGINFTGSVPTFQTLWKLVAKNLGNYRVFPRMIGECGGKNFHFIHNTADTETVANASVLAAFEYSGQKCSACSRMYVPQSIWPDIKERMLALHKQLKIASPLETGTFTSAVIDDKAFNRIKSYVDYAKSSGNVEVLAGGNCDNSKGYFIEPTILQTNDPRDKLMNEEIFGPVLTVYVYPDNTYKEVLHLIDNTSPYGLTGAVFAKDQSVVKEASEALVHACGNFYVNDKSTGSIVGQQPFGGGRLSGTNDKAGGPHYFLKFSSPQAIKTTHVPITSCSYPSME